jgi:hypothetical protein
MTIKELIDTLTEMVESGTPDDTEVRLAQQPRWAFEYEIGRVTEVNLNEPDPDDDEEADGTDEDRYVVYIGEGSQLGYLSGIAARELGWKE